MPPQEPRSSTPQTGTVYLVGAGPGDPGLLTLRGWECLRRADLVLYDGLVNPDLLRHTKAEAQRTCRSESPDGLRVPQEQINERLISAARSGQTVVRLKGGDPFIFGRGSEEAAALAAAGIPFEVVPGVTAATAAAVYTGVSLTHRDLSSAVAFITGHEAISLPSGGREPPESAHNQGAHAPRSGLDYGALANFPGTLVFYMGLDRLDRIASELIAHGKSAETPALVVSKVTTPFQRTVTAKLCEIASVVQGARLHAPSLLIIGDVVKVREQARWFEARPLFGQVIGITRPEEQADDAISLAYQLGAQPIVLPTIEISPPEDWSAVDAAISRLTEFDWIIFTSVNGVKGLLGRMWDIGGDGAANRSCEVGRHRPQHGGSAACLRSAGRRRPGGISSRSTGGFAPQRSFRPARSLGQSQPRPGRFAHGIGQSRHDGRASRRLPQRGRHHVSVG